MLLILGGLLIILSFFVPGNPIAAFLKNATNMFNHSKLWVKMFGLSLIVKLFLILGLLSVAKKITCT